MRCVRVEVLFRQAHLREVFPQQRCSARIAFERLDRVIGGDIGIRPAPARRSHATATCARRQAHLPNRADGGYRCSVGAPVVEWGSTLGPASGGLAANIGSYTLLNCSGPFTLDATIASAHFFVRTARYPQASRACHRRRVPSTSFSMSKRIVPAIAVSDHQRRRGEKRSASAPYGWIRPSIQLRFPGSALPRSHTNRGRRFPSGSPDPARPAPCRCTTGRHTPRRRKPTS